MNVETTIIDGKKYMEIDKLELNGSNYVFLVNSNDKNDYCIRKLVSSEGKIYYEGLSDDNEFDNVLIYFAKKHENLLNE